MGDDVVTEGASGMEQERRQHRRLAIELPLECALADVEREREGGTGGGGEHNRSFDRESGRVARTVTSNISTGGLYFELDLAEGVAAPRVDDVLQLVLTVPPGEGYSPYQGQVSSKGRIVRREELSADTPETAGAGETLRRVGLGVRFQEPLKLAF